ncbi:hypothetical protein [Aliikangiella sp. IMCC44632]
MNKRKTLSYLFLLFTQGTLSAANLEKIDLPGSPTASLSVVSGKAGSYVALRTAAALVEADTNNGLDGYLFNLETKEASLLVPQPENGSVTLTEGQSFTPLKFSDDGSRILMAGNSSLATAADNHQALVVYDFNTQEYYVASIDEAGNSMDYPDTTTKMLSMSGDGRYVIFSGKRWNNNQWEAKIYRRDLQQQTTEVVVESLDGANDGFFADRGVSIWDYSSDGQKALVKSIDGLFPTDDNDGEIDRFILDFSDGSASLISFITDEGIELELERSIIADPTFQYLLIESEGAVSNTDNYLVFENFAVYSIASQSTVGVADFLNLDESTVRSNTSILQARWGLTSNDIIIQPSSSLRIAGEHLVEGGPYRVDRSGQTPPYVVGQDNDGTRTFSLSSTAKIAARDDGLLYVAQDGETSVFSLFKANPAPVDLIVGAAADATSLTVSLINSSAEPIHNVGLSIQFPHFELTGEVIREQLSDCFTGTYHTSTEINDCPIGTIDANSLVSYTFDFSQDFEGTANQGKTVGITVIGQSLSDPDTEMLNNSATIQLSVPQDNSNDGNNDGNDNDESGDSGGGSLWLVSLIMLFLLSYRRGLQAKI